MVAVRIAFGISKPLLLSIDSNSKTASILGFGDVRLSVILNCASEKPKMISNKNIRLFVFIIIIFLDK